MAKENLALLLYGRTIRGSLASVLGGDEICARACVCVGVCLCVGEEEWSLVKEKERAKVLRRNLYVSARSMAPPSGTEMEMLK